MHINLKTTLLCSIVFASSNSFAANEMFTCDMNGKADIRFIFSSSSNKAELILDTTKVNGTVNINEHHYYFKFPKTGERYESHAIINRYSGKLTLEFGSPPFGKRSIENIHDTGACKKSNVKKVL